MTLVHLSRRAGPEAAAALVAADGAVIVDGLAPPGLMDGSEELRPGGRHARRPRRFQWPPDAPHGRADRPLDVEP